LELAYALKQAVDEGVLVVGNDDKYRFTTAGFVACLLSADRHLSPVIHRMVADSMGSVDLSSDLVFETRLRDAFAACAAAAARARQQSALSSAVYYAETALSCVSSLGRDTDVTSTLDETVLLLCTYVSG
jgi:hypothetical protein